MSLETVFLVLLQLMIAALILNNRRTSLAASLAAEQQRTLQAAQHAEVLQSLMRLQENLEQAQRRLSQRNSEQLAEMLTHAFSGLRNAIADDSATYLTALKALAEDTAELTGKYRNEQMEAMHHARRLADRMDGATQDFGRLIGDNTELLALAGQVRDTLALLGTRQDTLDGDMLRQSESIAAMGSAVEKLRTGFEQASENLLLQMRRALDTMSQRQTQGNSALQKELGDLLAKTVASMNKQLSTPQQAKIQTFR
ncbi:hypothetical protein [Pseudoduganella violaceinigra]|uniref:hypothetical protein n=1 Tax=Pseudoduganella violaceinigra TaxID=246602 RepID=UPI0004127BB2|nr:hypothetical protein [Pseudoduganella violaceinigra]